MGTEVTVHLPAPEDINRQIVDAIAKSAIGAQLGKVVDDAVKNMCSQHGDTSKVLRKVVEDQVVLAIRALLDTDEYKAMIAKAVKEYISEEVIKDMMSTIYEYWAEVRKYGKDSADRA